MGSMWAQWDHTSIARGPKVFLNTDIFSLVSLLTELSVPSSDQRVSSVMSGILNVSTSFRPSSRRK